MRQNNFHRKLTVGVIVFLVVVIAVLAQPLSAREVHYDRVQRNLGKLNNQTQEYLRNVTDLGEARSYLVRFYSSPDRSILSRFSTSRDYGRFNVSRVHGTAEDISAILGSSSVKYVEIDQQAHTLADGVPWGVNRTNATQAWRTTTGSGVKVALLDTGIASHSDLAVAGGTSVVGGTYEDTESHGTRVAGVVAARLNRDGLAGVAPNVSLYAVKVMEDTPGNLSDLIAGVEWAMDNNMSIISMSLGMDSYSQILKDVLRDAYTHGLLLVAAAGNTGGDVLYPAAYSYVIAVGATDSNDMRATSSAIGSELELVAPGEDINTTNIGGTYTVRDGTSFAAPHVTGVAALIWAQNRSLTNLQVRGKLRNDAIDLGNPGKDDEYGYGLIQMNLGTTNYSLGEDGYFYEIFNITGFGTENETYTFWTNGTGTIDDVEFLEGYYLVKKYIGSQVIEDVLHVSETGAIELLAVTVTFTGDGFTSDSSTTSDGYGWINENIYFTPNQQHSTEDDAYCVDFNYSGTADWDHCTYDDSSDGAACDSYSATLSGDGLAFTNFCETHGCANDTGFTETFLLNSSSIREQNVYVQWYRNCDNSGTPSQDEGTDLETYYIFDQRKAVCVSGVTYNVRGRYGTGASDWKNYNAGLSCNASSQCDYAIDENVTSSEMFNINPCRLQYNESCTSTNQCLTGLSCTGGICQGSETDLEILEIIPIQVIPDVDMVKDKTGYILVRVRNSAIETNAVVNVTYDGTKLSAAQGSSPTAYISAGAEVTFNFTFKPNTAGTGKTITANVSIIT